MKTDQMLWNPSNLVRAGWCAVWILALHWPVAAHANGLPDAVQMPSAEACEGLARLRTACPPGAPVAPLAPAVPEAESTEPGSPEPLPSQAVDGVDDQILCACMSIEEIPLHDAIVYRYKLRAHA